MNKWKKGIKVSMNIEKNANKDMYAKYLPKKTSQMNITSPRIVVIDINILHIQLPYGLAYANYCKASSLY